MKKIASLILGIMLLASPIASSAANAVKVGGACTNSGSVTVTTKYTMVCASNSTGATVWGNQLPVSKATLSMADAWIKSADKADMMTAAFGTFVNPTAKAVRVIAAYSSVSTFLQLHEVVMSNGAMKMQQKAAGFLIPAKGKYTLRPGADHTMIMSLKRDIQPGEVVTVTYVTSTGARFSQNFLAKVFDGANETYDPTPASTASKTFNGTGTGMASQVTITNPVMRLPDMMSPVDAVRNTYTTGGFMKITNSGTTDVVLTGGTSDYADAALRVDETVGTNQWTPMTNGLTIAAGKSVTLRMKGYHVTIIGVPKTVASGQKVNSKLTFKDGTYIPVVFQFMKIDSTNAIYGFATN